MSLLPVEHESRQQVSSKPVLRDDPKYASGKVAIFQYAAVGIFLFLIAGFWELQIKNPGVYSELADRNRIKALPLLAPRGKILDRDGRVIVDNHSSYTLLLSRETLKPEHLRPIADGLHLEYEDLLTQVKRYQGRPKYEPMIIKQELTPADIAFVEAHRDPEFFPEMELIHAERRLYPQNGLAAHVIGYTGEISESELDSPDFAKYSPGAVIGKFGIERQYNDILTGVDGQRQVVVNNRGREINVLGIKEATAGRNLRLTLDLDLQAVAELALEGKKGAVVALDPRNGEVLAMVSRPAFDPNKFSVRIRSADWKALINDPDHPLFNRAIQAQLAPGSTFKPLMALAGLETGSIDDSSTFHCAGGASFYGHYHRCWVKTGHGSVSLHKGIVQSCDVYFYNVGNKTGIDQIAFYANMAGLGKKTGIDLPGEADGTVPSSAWKIRNFREKWYPGETISVAIGQGALTLSPLQLASAIGGLAMGGTWFQPHLVKRSPRSEHPRQWTLSADNVQKVIDGMYGVVNEGGTGVRARIPGIEVCGKTGSAQVASNEYTKNKAHNEELKDNAWFVGFAPRKNPELVVAVLLQGAEHGKLAAPTARDVLKAYFDKKAVSGKPVAVQARRDGQTGRRGDGEKAASPVRVAISPTLPLSPSPTPASPAPRLE